MASMTCTTRETVTRTLGQFRKEGWISIEDSILTLHNPDQLQGLIVETSGASGAGGAGPAACPFFAPILLLSQVQGI